jgi:putative ABC transport system substrate-binding protein
MAGSQIGFLVATDKPTWKKYISAFENHLIGADWNIVDTPPQNSNDVKIIYSEALGNPANFRPMADAFVRTPVDIIVTAGTASARNCMDATNAVNPPGKIPVVFASAGDPVGAGLVDSLKNPGGNVTGGYNQQMNLAFKRVEELREQWFRGHGKQPVTQIKLGIMYTDLPNSAGTKEMGIVTAAANFYGFDPPTIVKLDSTNPGADIPTKVRALRQAHVNALYVCSDPVITENADLIAGQCDPGGGAQKIETMHQFREYHDNHNGTWSYGANFQTMFAKAADYVSQILRSGSPATFAGTLPVFEPPIIESVPPWP